MGQLGKVNTDSIFDDIKEFVVMILVFWLFFFKGLCLLNIYISKYLRMKWDDLHKNDSVRGSRWEINATGLARRVNCWRSMMGTWSSLYSLYSSLYCCVFIIFHEKVKKNEKIPFRKIISLLQACRPSGLFK